jgi:putative transposase
MSQSFAKIYAHIVFSTKFRFPFLSDIHLRDDSFSYIAGILATLDSIPIIVNGFSDHVHILGLISKNIPVSQIVGEVKRVSSIWMKLQGESQQNFHWQNGYGAFSIGRSEVDAVQTYIKNQLKHHSRKTFQEEYRIILKENEIEYDEEYIWN